MVPILNLESFDDREHVNVPYYDIILMDMFLAMINKLSDVLILTSSGLANISIKR